jgi:hypothetical protein
MSRSDEKRLVERQLVALKMPAKTKGRTEQIAELEEEELRPRGTYMTSTERWTCSCPSYLTSRFLLCKHLVRIVNEKLGNTPLTDLRFFLNLRRRHYPPYYILPGIHTDTSMSAGAERRLEAVDKSLIDGGQIADASTLRNEPPENQKSRDKEGHAENRHRDVVETEGEGASMNELPENENDRDKEGHARNRCCDVVETEGVGGRKARSVEKSTDELHVRPRCCLQPMCQLKSNYHLRSNTQRLSERTTNNASMSFSKLQQHLRGCILTLPRF